MGEWENGRMGTRVPKHLTSTVRTLHSAYLLKTRCVKYSLVLSNSELRNEPSEISSGALATMESCGRGRERGREGGAGVDTRTCIYNVYPNRQEEMDGNQTLNHHIWRFIHVHVYRPLL